MKTRLTHISGGPVPPYISGVRLHRVTQRKCRQNSEATLYNEGCPYLLHDAQAVPIIIVPHLNAAVPPSSEQSEQYDANNPQHPSKCQRLDSYNKSAIQDNGPDAKWTRKSLAYRKSNIFHLCVTRPQEICVNLVFKQIHAASNYTICR